MSPKAKVEFPVWAALEYLGAETPHVRSNGYEWMLCPFHLDSKPSAHVSRLGFVCFACGVKGDAIKLLREQGGMNYQAAVAILTERTGGEDRAGPQQRQWGESLLG